MRLFVALELPASVVAALETVQQQLRQRGSHPVKWVTPGSIHLTLQFLGEVPDTQVPDILVALQQARTQVASYGQLQLRLSTVGSFPNLRRPQTIWVGVAGDVAGLARMQQAVNTALQPLGFAPETRPFRAHLTLGRVRREAAPVQRDTLSQALAQLPTPPLVTWESGWPLLFQSTLTRDGAVYQVLGPE